MLLFYDTYVQNYCLGTLKKNYTPRILGHIDVLFMLYLGYNIVGDENKLSIFERKVLRKMYAPVYNLDTQVWEERV